MHFHLTLSLLLALLRFGPASMNMDVEGFNGPVALSNNSQPLMSCSSAQAVEEIFRDVFFQHVFTDYPMKMSLSELLPLRILNSQFFELFERYLPLHLSFKFQENPVLYAIEHSNWEFVARFASHSLASEGWRDKLSKVLCEGLVVTLKNKHKRQLPYFLRIVSFLDSVCFAPNEQENAGTIELPYETILRALADEGELYLQCRPSNFFLDLNLLHFTEELLSDDRITLIVPYIPPRILLNPKLAVLKIAKLFLLGPSVRLCDSLITNLSMDCLEQQPWDENFNYYEARKTIQVLKAFKDNNLERISEVRTLDSSPSNALLVYYCWKSNKNLFKTIFEELVPEMEALERQYTRKAIPDLPRSLATKQDVGHGTGSVSNYDAESWLEMYFKMVPVGILRMVHQANDSRGRPAPFRFPRAPLTRILPPPTSRTAIGNNNANPTRLRPNMSRASFIGHSAAQGRNQLTKESLSLIFAKVCSQSVLTRSFSKDQSNFNASLLGNLLSHQYLHLASLYIDFIYPETAYFPQLLDHHLKALTSDEKLISILQTLIESKLRLTLQSVESNLLHLLVKFSLKMRCFRKVEGLLLKNGVYQVRGICQHISAAAAAAPKKSQF